MKDNKFIILVTQHNTVDYIIKCLDSVILQNYENYEVIVMDDCSTDGTWEIIQDYPFNSVRNKVKLTYPVCNFLDGIKYFSHDPEDIIVFLSGDDWLSGDDVLSHLNDIYQEDVWMTYGNFIPLSGRYGPYCKPIPDTKTYRKSGQWYASHLITCKKWLWDKIDDKDLRYEDGNYPNFSFDRAFLYPLIEMSGNKHIRYVEKILYIYNDLNPASVTNSNPQRSVIESVYFMKKPIYPEL